eukprot:Opistho-2@13425
MGKARRRKTRTHVPDEVAAAAPKSFVMRRGLLGRSVTQLMVDTRRMMEPNTASRLRVQRRNVLKDFVSVAGPLGVSHFLIFSRTDVGAYLRIARLPRGPTLNFRVEEYTLAKDVLASQKKPKAPSAELRTAPLLVLNNFGGDDKSLKLMTTMFQNLFPSISIETVKLASIRRCVLLNYNSETKAIDLRHYKIGAQPVGMTKSVKRLLQTQIPNLNELSDISEYVIKNAQASESDVEDGEDSRVVLPQRVPGRGNESQKQSAIRLSEIGPRMSLKIIKIEAGMCDGEIIHHEFVSKTPDEVAATAKLRDEKKKLKEERRRMQERNVAAKKAAQDSHKQKCLGGMDRKRKRTGDDDGTDSGDDADGDSDDESEERGDGGDPDDVKSISSDDDAAYYRQAVGAEPEEGMFDGGRSGKDGHRPSARGSRGGRGRGRGRGRGDSRAGGSGGDRPAKRPRSDGGDGGRASAAASGGERRRGETAVVRGAASQGRGKVFARRRK